MKKYLLIIIVVLSLGFISFAQGQETTIVVDQMGREVEISSGIESIISLSPSNTEILFELGLEDIIVGVTDFCNYPEETKNKKSVGGFSNPNLELMLELEPHLVLAGDIHEEIVMRLEERGIPVLVVRATTIEEVFEGMLLVGTVTQIESQAEFIVEGIKDRIEIVQKSLSSMEEEDRVRVYYELWYDPIMSIGNSSFIHDLISVAGGVNIFKAIDDSYPMVSSEAVAEKNPQVIVYPDDHGSAQMIKEQFLDRPGWGHVSAIKDGRIHGVDSDIFNRPGPRLIEAIEKAANLFYPEIFKY